MSVTTPAEIQVYASFPRVVATGTDFDIVPSNWHWVHCLTFPLETLTTLQFSHRPYKWIRYAIGVVVGAEGDLSFGSDPVSVVDYDAGLPSESVILYYHTTDEEKRRMFPVGPSIARTNITSSVATTRRAQFRDDVAERDGGVCVLANVEPILCDAAHLLAHAKGDTYIKTYTQHRSRDPTGQDIVEKIDSVRNGLFLNKYTHALLGKHIAFLMTPNFAMTTADVDPTALPTERRYTAHTFRFGDTLSLGGTRPATHPSSVVLRSSNTHEWPPAVLFDTIYATAVLHHFGTQTLEDYVAGTWNDTFDPGGVMTTADADYKVITDKRASAAERTQNQAQDHQTRYNGRPDAVDMLMALPYIGVPRDQLKATIRDAQERAEAMEQRRVQEKVETWMKQVAAA